MTSAFTRLSETQPRSLPTRSLPNGSRGYPTAEAVVGLGEIAVQGDPDEAALAEVHTSMAGPFAHPPGQPPRPRRRFPQPQPHLHPPLIVTSKSRRM
ncbi:hypothetical protein JCM13664_15630 [Methylothermus subterraneus]